ncbi:MAG: DUF6797 domain-containing protein, partial [Verrucomicrobiota bacterium]
TISLDPMSARGILAHKGIAVRLSDEAVVVFDTDLLRLAGAWTGGFLKWYPARDGLQEFPSPDGFMHFATARKPGWSADGRFRDSRAWKYGPISQSEGRYEGLYLKGDRVVFSYRVGERKVLESHRYARVDGEPVFSRILNVSGGESATHLQVLQAPDGDGSSIEVRVLSPNYGYVSVQSGLSERRVFYRGLTGDAIWRLSERQLTLELPAGGGESDFELGIGAVSMRSAEKAMPAGWDASHRGLDLEGLTEAGEGRWDALKTEILSGEEKGPFAVDDFAAPHDNPWNSFLRFSGVDFLSENRAVLCSLSGDVWLVDGIASDSGTARWTRFATGLYQPLGIKVVNGVIHVTGRDQITRLRDLNGDGEADYYENFNNEVMASNNFHAFTLNLDTDSKGNFYFAKATPWPPEKNGVKAEVTPHHGVLFRMPPDGSSLEVVATGLRNPNGMSIGPNDEILYSDNQGNWVPTSKVHRIREGAFHGFIPSVREEEPPKDFEKPMAWLPHFADNSPSTPTFITSRTWPEVLQGQVVLTSYGRGNLAFLLNEEVDGVWQSTHVSLPLRFESGTQHSRFHDDGHLYIAGLTSWQSVGHGGDWGSFHRVRYTGLPLHLPVAFNARTGELELVFSDALDFADAADSANYKLRVWTYPWSSQYGTRGKVFSAFEPGRAGADVLAVDSVEVSEDGRKATLAVPGLSQKLVSASVASAAKVPDSIDASLGLVAELAYRLKFADGYEAKQTLHKTIHRLPGGAEEENGNESRWYPHGSMSNEEVDMGRAEKALEMAEILEGVDRLIDMKATGVALSFDPSEIKAKVGETVGIRFANDSDMVHNLLVLFQGADVHAVGLAALSAPREEYVPSSHSDSILAASRLAQPGETVAVRFEVSEKGVYPFICSYSGHFTMMKGRIIVE